MAHTNIEIKAESDNQDKIKRILKNKNAVFKGEDHQIDTYFSVNAGRLKLREGKIENCLVHYQRQNHELPKQSNLSLFKAEPCGSLKDVLTNAPGVLVVVDKKREIYFIDNVKFHIDTVKGLGSFVEIEAIDTGGISKEKLLEQCNYYPELFNINCKNLVVVSYSDMLLNSEN